MVIEGYLSIQFDDKSSEIGVSRADYKRSGHRTTTTRLTLNGQSVLFDETLCKCYDLKGDFDACTRIRGGATTMVPSSPHTHCDKIDDNDSTPEIPAVVICYQQNSLHKS
ncbi:predicted protein [Botrytis cinerea T4]|uniref:Uncharacterized protein n=1 Tax=Botryotinia fuckeliana (strain T4) TaxID=999810 RepID=G2YXM0_BOTF4|nr:predicted protein [Botrytis cinerea T4]